MKKLVLASLVLFSGICHASTDFQKSFASQMEDKYEKILSKKDMLNDISFVDYDIGYIAKLAEETEIKTVTDSIFSENPNKNLTEVATYCKYGYCLIAVKMEPLENNEDIF